MYCDKSLGEKRHICSVCTKRFLDLKSLKIHMKVHTGEKPYSCKLCDFRSVYPAALYTHTKSHKKQL